MRIPALYRWFNRLFAPLAPTGTGALAAKLFLTPRPPRESPSEKLLERVGLPTGAEARILGSGAPVVLLHGWSSSPEAFDSFVTPLLRENLRVIAIRCPGHAPGETSRSHPGLFVDTLLEAGLRFGRMKAVIGHSMGANAALAAAADGVSIDRVVAVSGPASVSSVLDRFARDACLPSRAAREFRARVVRAVGRSERYFDSSHFGPRLRCPTLLVHDGLDQEIPFEDAITLARNVTRSKLIATQGLGHRRILRDPAVVSSIIEFITEPRQVTSTADLP